ncbi:pasang lhamu isoform 1-T7 [Glossina fuscipes fuscipes]
MLIKFANFTNRYKVIRGMISYGLLWPTGCLFEQTFVEKRTFQTYDWDKCLRYGLFGCFVLGPALYCWIRVANTMWPRADIGSALCKAYTEQIAYDPFAITGFLFVMTLTEKGKTLEDAQREVSMKFFDAYKVGFIYWPIVQTYNFAFVRPKNQVVVSSIFSTLWTAFLSYVKYVELQRKDGKHHFDLKLHKILDWFE